MEKIIITGGFASNSASPTDIIYGKYGNTDVICKVFLEEYLYYKNLKINEKAILLNHEADVYKYLREKVINPYMIRNILYMIDSKTMDFNEYLSFILDSKRYQSSELFKLSKNQIIRNVISNTKYMIDSSGKRNKISYNSSSSSIRDDEYYIRNIDIRDSTIKMIITPKIEGMSLGDYISNNSKIITENEFMRYMFVIFVTLESMAIRGINQNDLHWGNILMSHNYYGSTKYQLRNYFLLYGDNILYIDNNFTPIVYDFDRASIRGKYIKNLDWAENWGNCPNFHPKRDILKMLCCMYWEIKLNKLDKNRSFQIILDELMNKILKSNKLRDAIKNEDTYKDQKASSCWLRGKPSFLCLEKHLDDNIADIEEILNWCLKWTDYKSISLRQVHDNQMIDMNTKEIVNRFRSQLLGNINDNYIYYNVQIFKYRNNKILTLSDVDHTTFLNSFREMIYSLRRKRSRSSPKNLELNKPKKPTKHIPKIKSKSKTKTKSKII